MTQDDGVCDKPFPVKTVNSEFTGKLTQDEIIAMARKAGGEEALGEEGELMIFPVVFLPRFANLIEQRVRSEIALEKLADIHEELGRVLR